MNKISPLHQTYGSAKLKVAAYARISRDKLDLENSLETQIRHYTTIIRENPAWEFAGIYADDGISGSSIKKRNQFQLMLTKAFEKEIDVILVKSISRFARNVIDLLSTIQELRDSGIEVYFEKENISTFDTKSDAYITLYAKFAEEELVSMSRNVNWSNSSRMKKGKYYLNAAQLYGFMFDDGRNVIINEKEAKWVRDMFAMYAAGKNTAEIADYLEENNVVSISGNDRWASTTIRRIIKNEKYCGDVILQKTFTKDPISQRRIPNNGEKEKYIIRDALPAIVDRSLWELCQRKMKEHAELYNIGNKNCKNLTTPFTGFGFCPYCRNNYFRKFNRKTEMLYCSSNKSRLMCTESESVYIDDLKKIIPLLVKKLKVNEAELRKELLRVFGGGITYGNQTESLNESNEDIDDLTVQIDDLRSQLNNYNKYQGEAFDAIRKEIKKAISELENKIYLSENERITNIRPESRVASIIRELRKFPNEEDIGTYDFRRLFKQMIVINRDRLIFVIGSDDMDKLPRNPNSIPMLFVESYKYKVRSTTSTCYFGICINK